MGNDCEGEQAVPETESPVYREIRIIGEKLEVLEKTSHILTGRLSKILSEATPEDKKEAEKPSGRSALETSLITISRTIESNIIFLRDITNRLTV